MDEGIGTKIERLEETINKLVDDNGGSKPKEFKLPFKARVSKIKNKKNWVTVIKINENRNLEFIKEKIDNQTVIVDKIPRLATGEYIFNYKNKPIMILPSWSVNPLTASELYNSSLKDGSNIVGYSILLAAMKSGEISKKKKMSLGIGIGVIVIIGIIGYSFFQK